MACRVLHPPGSPSLGADLVIRAFSNVVVAHQAHAVAGRSEPRWRTTRQEPLLPDNAAVSCSAQSASLPGSTSGAVHAHMPPCYCFDSIYQRPQALAFSTFQWPCCCMHLCHTEPKPQAARAFPDIVL